MLNTFSTAMWDDHYPLIEQEQAVDLLEDGSILYFPNLAFPLTKEEQVFLSPDFADPHAKNISYQASSNRLWGFRHLSDTQHIQLKYMLNRFYHHTFDLLTNLLLPYAAHLVPGRTSYRPVQIADRTTSYRKDDKRLHVDAFPSAPNQGKRILRIFCNINPHGEDRIWRIGEPFQKVAQQFIPTIAKPLPGSATLLRLLKITKSCRTPYDHYMLRIHDSMKASENYQKQADQQTVRFPPGSSWIVQTDDVSHAAMTGQYVLEQTFYLPVKAMKDSAKSPLAILENMLNRKLV